MDFTEIYRQTTGLVSFSGDSQWVLTAVQDRLILRHGETFQITRTWLVNTSPAASNEIIAGPSTSKASGKSNDAWITHIGWSTDSTYMLACCAKRGIVNVYSLRDEDWTAKIESGVEGLVKAEWAPDGRSIIAFSEWGLRVTIWSLVTGSATYIQFPKYPDRGYAFRQDSRYFVLAERHKSKDTIGVYDTLSSYQLTRHFPLPTSSLSSLALSPAGDHIAVWEGPLEYKLCILNLSGQHLGTFVPDPDPGLGIRCAVWHPSGTMLAVGGWDDKIHVLNSLSWTPIITLELQSRIPDDVKAWREPPNWLELTHGRGFLSYEQLSSPVVIPITRHNPSKAQTRGGVVQLAWDEKGTSLLVRFDNTPLAVHIFAFPAPPDEFKPRLRTILLHTQPVISAQWNPVRSGSLVICCGNGAMYTWSDEWVAEDGGEGENEPEEMAECIGVPAKKFETRDVRWGPDGKSLVLLDKEMFCCAFEVVD